MQFDFHTRATEAGLRKGRRELHTQPAYLAVWLKHTQEIVLHARSKDEHVANNERTNWARSVATYVTLDELRMMVAEARDAGIDI